MNARPQELQHRLRELQRSLPTPPRPAGAYRAVLIRDGLGFVSGQFPFVDGKLQLCGRVGAELSEADGRRAAAVAALNVLAQICEATAGFDRFVGLLRVDGYVASAAGYVAQPRVLDAASERLVQSLGPDLGAHARTAIAVARLPMNAPVELAVTFAVSSR